MLRLDANDCFVENLRNVFCRFRQSDMGVGSGCRADIERVDVWRDRVQKRAGRANMAFFAGVNWKIQMRFTIPGLFRGRPLVWCYVVRNQPIQSETRAVAYQLRS